MYVMMLRRIPTDRVLRGAGDSEVAEGDYGVHAP
jgi:hypothetical protein